MARHIAVVLLVVAALAALAASSPVPEDPSHEDHRRLPEDHSPVHALQRRSPKSIFNKIKDKVKKVVHKIDMKKLRDCLKSTPGVSDAVKSTLEGCATTAMSGNMASIATCTAKKAAMPAARAVSHLAVCMG